MNGIWNHRLVLHNNESDPTKHWIGVHAIYYDDMGQQVSWTTEPQRMVSPADEGKEGMITVLMAALKDILDTDEVLLLSDLKQADG